MTGPDEYVPFHMHPLGFLEGFGSLGADRDGMLKAADLPGFKRVCDLELITLPQLRALLVSGLSQCREPHMGYRIGSTFPWCYYGDLAGVIETSPSLREAGAAFRRYTAIAHPYMKRFLAHVNFYFEDSARLVVPVHSPPEDTVPDALRQFDLDFRTAITCRLLSSCGHRELSQGIVLRLEQQEPLPESVIKTLGVDQVVYGAAANSLSAAYEFFTSEWRNIRRPLFNRIIARCENVYQAAGLSDSISDSVRWHVDNRFIRNIELEPIAAVLGMSARSLSRKLAAEGVCFRDIVLQARINLSLRHVIYSRLGIEEMAALVGFSTASSFMRAIKSWTGLTVMELRTLAVVDAEKILQQKIMPVD